MRPLVITYLDVASVASVAPVVEVADEVGLDEWRLVGWD